MKSKNLKSQEVLTASSIVVRLDDAAKILKKKDRGVTWQRYDNIQIARETLICLENSGLDFCEKLEKRG